MTSHRVLVIDNYDSFVFNLVQYLAELGAEPITVRNDVVGADRASVDALIDEHDPAGVLISPGPGYPSDAGISNEVVRAAVDRGLPLFGVCLGHQCIGEVYGAKTVHAPDLLHGKTSPVEHDDSGVLQGLPNPFTATRYHSLVVSEDDLAPEIVITGRTANGTVMALRHRDLPIDAVQFHPESVLTEQGYRIIANWLQARLGLDGAVQRAAQLDRGLDAVRANAQFSLT